VVQWVDSECHGVLLMGGAQRERGTQAYTYVHNIYTIYYILYIQYVAYMYCVLHDVCVCPAVSVYVGLCRASV
jgi:hypothetical protein